MSTPAWHWSVLEAIRCWQRSRRAAREAAFELQCAGTAEVERIAQELGLSSFELRTLVSYADSRDLLKQRMAVLQLSPSALARSDPAAFRDLQSLREVCFQIPMCP